MLGVWIAPVIAQVMMTLRSRADGCATVFRPLARMDWPEWIGPNGLAGSAGKTRLRHTADAKIVDGEERAPQDAISREAWQGGFCHAGDEENIEIHAAEHHARHFFHRHLDDTVDAAVRAVAHDLAD